MLSKLNKYSVVIIAIIAILLFLLLIACSKEDSITKGLTYTVDNELSFNADYNLNNFDDADKLESKITNHVDIAVNDMNNIFNKRRVSILDYGAKPCEIINNEPGKFKANQADQAIMDDYAKNNTKAIYKTFCEVSKQGGGTIVVPAANGKVFYTCALHLEDNINLFIEEGATLKFTTNTNLFCGDFMKEVYGDGVDDKGLTLTRYESIELMNYSPLIYAYGKKNIAISGKGTLDGSASMGDKVNPGTGTWEDWRIKTTINGKEGIYTLDIPRAKLFADAQNNIEVSKRQYGPGTGSPTSGSDDGWLRPNFVQPYNCQNFYIKDLKIINSPMWNINPIMCDTVLMENLNINSHMGNNDGVDPESTSNMVIRNNIFNVGDDCVAVKSGRNADGLRLNKPTYNLVIHDNLMEDGAGDGGIAIGSEITGGVKNVFSHNNTMLSENILNPYKFKTNYIRGGFIENIFLRDDNVKVVNSKNCAISVDLNYDVKQEVEKMKATGAKFNAYMPSFKNVHIKNFKANQDKLAGKGGKFTFQFRGFLKDSVSDECMNKNDATDCYVSGITIEDSSFYGSNQAFDLQYVDGLVLRNVYINGSVVEDKFIGCKNLDFDNCDFTNSKINHSSLETTENSKISNCRFD